ncbi:DNA mismatch repair protein MutS [Anaerobranca gottschalkii]|uniref:DNA mismatch repair protein MutS n=1 Tax=Anaerobranca gottschalkii DSM 13577 TaxID=1120990 RepID=A0A1H9Z6Z1_9FIRM|nr:DNA mismatch repair protein MutS [Anaerobranca gottschalkii]SES77269.1 DNA mismatch repair protein MutS [Anaerobranca gottschalkii DSM 13577]
MAKLTPMIQQYIDIKEQYKDCLLLFRVGDFYEMFFEDAVIGAKALEIALTARDGDKNIPLAGVPYHSLDSYLGKLIKKGFKVAICEQVEDPKECKGIVKREVVRVITPGTVTDENLLESKDNNFICSISTYSNKYGLSLLDNSTGEFFFTEGKIDLNGIFSLLVKYNPAEIIVFDDNPFLEKLNLLNANISIYEIKKENLTQFNQLLSNVNNYPIALKAVELLLSYIMDTQKSQLKHINHIYFINSQEYMALDYSTIRNLEITTTIKDNKKEGSLLWVLDKTKSPMGGRKLKQWILNPLLQQDKINYRLDIVEKLYNNLYTTEKLSKLIDSIYDLERIGTKIVYNTVNPKDLVALKTSLSKLPLIKDSLLQLDHPSLNDLANKIVLLDDLVDIIDKGIVDNPPTHVKEGGIIKKGFNEELDKLKYTAENGRKWLGEYEHKLKSETGIKTLKIGYNKVFGYYIEVTRTNTHLVPESFQRKQTLANAERYFTAELKEYEELILGAADKIIQLEYNLFCDIRQAALDKINEIQKNSEIIAELDCYCTFAIIASENNYTKPIVDTSDEIIIKAGRHPVIEQMIAKENFISNDTLMDCRENRMLIITGPNMAGKSTYMRQVALITLMAQIGSFVPAKSAKIGIVDRIFTRVGASDDLSSGQSTFMVEMNELANILKNATKKSLIILDEVGRGTSTFDGMSIAQGAVEYILNPDILGAKTLFATHYHQLTSLEEKYSGIKNYSIAVKEENDQITFLHSIIPGGSDKSYGIQVAKLAGVPSQVIRRAKEILHQLENGYDSNNQVATTKDEDLFSHAFEDYLVIIEELKDLDLNNITPIEAMMFLSSIKKKLERR